jgi:hypothetical protein
MRFAPFALCALLLACSGVTEPICACSPPGGGAAVITGVVTAPDAAPVAGARVLLRLLNDGSCAEMPTTMTWSAETAASGVYRLNAGWSGGPEKCFHIWAEAPTDSPLSAAEGRTLRIDFGRIGVVPDTIEIDFRLR